MPRFKIINEIVCMGWTSTALWGVRAWAEAIAKNGGKRRGYCLRLSALPWIWKHKGAGNLFMWRGRPLLLLPFTFRESPDVFIAAPRGLPRGDARATPPDSGGSPAGSRVCVNLRRPKPQASRPRRPFATPENAKRYRPHGFMWLLIARMP